MGRDRTRKMMRAHGERAKWTFHILGGLFSRHVLMLGRFPTLGVCFSQIEARKLVLEACGVEFTGQGHQDRTLSCR